MKPEFGSRRLLDHRQSFILFFHPADLFDRHENIGGRDHAGQRAMLVGNRQMVKFLFLHQA
jgi:hypothetical protein